MALLLPGGEVLDEGSNLPRGCMPGGGRLAAARAGPRFGGRRAPGNRGCRSRDRPRPGSWAACAGSWFLLLCSRVVLKLRRIRGHVQAFWKVDIAGGGMAPSAAGTMQPGGSRAIIRGMTLRTPGPLQLGRQEAAELRLPATCPVRRDPGRRRRPGECRHDTTHTAPARPAPVSLQVAHSGHGDWQQRPARAVI